MAIYGHIYEDNRGVYDISYCQDVYIYMALPPSWHQHCTDEVQKAETVQSAVI